MNTKRTHLILMIIAIFMSAATIALGIALGITLAQKNSEASSLDNLYEKSYFETINALDSAHSDLEKVTVVDSEKIKEDLLLDVWSNCNIAIDNLGQLSTESEHLPDVLKMLNQIGDYSRYLSKKGGEGFTDEEKANLNTFINVIDKLSTSLSEVEDQLIKGEKIKRDILSETSTLTENLDTIDYTSIDYLELIYDGPFSDGLSDREPKNIKDAEEISQQQAKDLVLKYFENATEISFLSESSVTLSAYLFEFKLDNKVSGISISKKGGKVIQYNTYREINNPQLDDDQCIAKATEYIAQMGYSDMKPVWISNNNSTVYVNFAYEKDNIVYYPDLIKIKLSGEDGTLLGVEAQNYLYNHIDRNTQYPNVENISVNASLDVKSKTVCVIPTEWNKEILCLEVVASKDDNIYYVYYNVENGQEERILIVVDEDGQLLI